MDLMIILFSNISHICERYSLNDHENNNDSKSLRLLLKFKITLPVKKVWIK